MLKTYNKLGDFMIVKYTEKEMELLQAQIDATNAKASQPDTGGAGTGVKTPKDDTGKGHSYANKLEQKQHEKVSPDKKFQRLQKAQA